MNKTVKILLIGVVSLVIILAGIHFYAMLLMEDEDHQIGIEFLSPLLQDGDLIFQTSQSSQSKAIQLATKSKYSHMGMIYTKGNKTYVVEAVQPVKLTPIEEWVKKGKNGYYIVKRLRKADKILTQEVKLKMRLIGENYLGKDYDQYFEWSDKRIYCSELIWKIYKEAANIEIGELQKLRDFDLSNKIVKQALRTRYGDKIPLDELVISPVQMLNSDKLITIYEE
ncbi:MAG: YiiX family permuted papain-like enzyme [Bacteroidales bacterium]|nr:YiiX family permuted papain-like enzyme [Bacteroidales bacterium]